MKPLLSLNSIKIFKAWEPNSQPISMIYRPRDNFNDLAENIIKILDLDQTPQDLIISSSNPLIPEIDSRKTFGEQGITCLSQLFVNIKSTDQKQPIDLLKQPRPAHCTPLTKLIEKDGKNSAPAGYDLTQKIIIFYGIAASLYQYHERSPIKVNIMPNYIFVDDKFRPYIDYDNLTVDSQNKDINDNDKYKPYLSPEVFSNKKPASQDDEAEMKADVYTFGSICLSIIKKKILTEKTAKDSITQVPPKLRNLIDLCRDDSIAKRPSFCDILFILTSQVFIDDLENFDAERFRAYQKTVVGEEFITVINSHFDIKKIPGVKIRQRSEFTIDNKIIGKGMSGSVRIATDNVNGQKVAFKELNIDMNEKDQMRIYREIEILASTDHYSIQNLYGYIEANKEERMPAVILTKYESKGCLNKYIDKKYSTLDFTQKYIIMYGIASGMYYLHNKNIMHRDIKPENILITKNTEPQITDFGLSKVSQENEMFQSIVITGTPIYMAPELLDSGDGDFFSLYDARLADVYAFGLVLVYLFTGKRPWSNVKQVLSLASKSLSGERPSLPKDFPKMLRLLIQACWDQEPTERPSFENILHIIGNQLFISNLGEEIDMARFKDYQKKVFPDDSFLSENLSKTAVKGTVEDNILIKEIKFPKIPEDRFCSILDFSILSEEKDENANPFFIVRKAILKSKSKKLFKIFKMKDEFIDDIDILKCYSTQIQVMLDVDHPALNKLYGNLNMPSKRNSKDESLYDYFPKEVKGLPELVTPTSKRGNLHTNLHNFTITEKFIILYGMAAGMYYLHSKKIVHLNLKPENISLNDNYEPLIDLDLTSRPESIKENLFYLLPIFSHAYVAPELLNFDEDESKNDDIQKADIYSFGMIAYYLMTGIQPFNSNRGFHYILMKIKNGERPLTSGIVSYPFDKLIEDCWTTDPTKRPTFKDILSRMGSSNFVRSIEHVEVKKFQKYQQKVVSKEFISSISQCAIRTRDEFELSKMIGSGMFGNVRLAIDKLNKNKVAYKEIPSKDNNFIEREKEILSTMNFPSIITLYGLIEPDEEKENSVILLPYAQNGDLDKMLQMASKNKGRVPAGWDYTQRCIVLYGVAMGMYKLHQNEIIHRDLKPQNILLDDNLEPLITDFELSKFVDPNQSMFQSMIVGTPYYMSPESFDEKTEIESEEGEQSENKKHKYDGKLSDVYSFGMLIFYLMSGIQPWANIKTQFVLMQKVIDGVRPTIPDNVEKPVSDLITQCWKAVPKDRPNFKEICDIVSDPNFYANPNHSFDKKRFYDYQLKLGETEFIKFSQKEIDSFKVSVKRSPRKTIVLNTVQILREMADKGDAESQYRYGCLLKEGVEVQQDLEEAASYFKLSSDQDYLEGIIAYATCLKDGIGIEKDEPEAFNLMKNLVDKDITEAEITLANWYSDTRPKKYGLAYELYKKADAKGYPDASAFIGSLMEKRKLGVNPSNDEIVQYYKKACRLGSSVGMYHMATFYHYGLGVNKDIKEAIRLYTLSAQISDSNQSSAIFSLTVLYEETGDYDSAFSIADYYRSKDMFVGYVRCSDLYKKGIGVEKDDKLAKECMDIACEKRFNSDQLSLALLYSRAKGVTQNKEKTFFWTEIAAKNGNVPAQANLASYYLDAFGCKQDIVKAEEYGIMSSNAGNGHGMWALARIYKKKRDDAKELEFLEKASKSGYEKALVDLGKKYKDKKKNNDAVECFKEAAENRIPLGLFYYGRELMHGKHAPKNFDEGFQMIQDAAEMGCREAVKKLIDIYTKGENGIEKDDEKAEKYTDILAKMDKGKRRKSIV